MKDFHVIKFADALQIKFNEYLVGHFPQLIVMVKSTPKMEIFNVTSIREFAEMFIIRFSTILIRFLKVIAALLLQKLLKFLVQHLKGLFENRLSEPSI